MTPYFLYLTALHTSSYLVARRSHRDIPPALQVAEIRRFLDYAIEEYGNVAGVTSAFVAWIAIHCPADPLPIILKDTSPALTGEIYVIRCDRHDANGRPVVMREDHVVKLDQPVRRLRAAGVGALAPAGGQVSGRGEGGVLRGHVSAVTWRGQ